jgi:hypothetical protein
MDGQYDGFISIYIYNHEAAIISLKKQFLSIRRLNKIGLSRSCILTLHDVIYYGVVVFDAYITAGNDWFAYQIIDGQTTISGTYATKVEPSTSPSVSQSCTMKYQCCL